MKFFIQTRFTPMYKFSMIIKTCKFIFPLLFFPFQETKVFYRNKVLSYESRFILRM